MAMTPNVPLMAWSPDGDPTLPGILTDVVNVYPTRRGFAADANGTAYSTPLAGKCYGARMVQIASGTNVLLAATAGDLYYYNGTSFVSRSGGSYTLATDPTTGWRFDQFGEATLAIQRDNKLKASTAIQTTNFSDVTAAPSALTMCVASNFVMVANTYDLPSANSYRYTDAWWCSALGDYTDWTPDLATQCDRGRLRQTPGGVERLVAYGPDVIAFKRRSMIRGRYVNRPAAGIIWEWQVISNEVGIAGPEAVVQVGGLLYWMSVDGPYVFNGAQVQPIKSFPHLWFRDALASDPVDSFPHRLTQAVYDPERRLVRWHFCRALNADPSEATSRWTGGCLTYHLDTDRWGYSTHRSEWAVNIPTQTASLYEAAFISADTHALMAYRGVNDDSTIETGDIGDDDAYMFGARARLRFLAAPTTCAGAHLYRNTLDVDPTLGESVVRDDGKFDFSYSARWHRLRISMAGDWEVSGLSFDATKAGTR